MIPLLAAKAIPTKTIAYIVGVLVALHVFGVYPADVLVMDILSVAGDILGAVRDWLTNIVKNAVRDVIPGSL